MKLTIELVPSTCWYSNLRNAVSREVWDKIRFKAYKASGNRCKICMIDRMLYCHEVWSYDDEKHIQTLVGFEALCEPCHMVKHIGFAGIRALDGELDFDKVIAHFMRVNRCSREEFDKAVALAFEVWEERSSHTWKCELGEFKDLLKVSRC